ncbi:hypothetical protein D3C81_176550 [compost metagenome]
MDEAEVKVTDLREIFTYIGVRNVGLGMQLSLKVLRRCEELNAVHPKDTRFSFMLSNDHRLAMVLDGEALPSSERLYFHCFTLGAEGEVLGTNTLYLLNLKLGMIDDQTSPGRTVH